VSSTPSSVSAEVILRSKSGHSLVSEDAIVTSANVEDFYPSQETINDAASKLKSLGFDVSSSAHSISIVGKPELFEKVFNTKLTTTKTNGSTIINFDKEPRIPSSLENTVERVVFSPPVTYLR
jgi:subtilase family serine protease